MLSPALTEAIQQALAQAGDATPVRAVERLSGGDINHAARVDTSRQSYFVKWHDSPPPRFFEAEARGLALLVEARCVRVPAVIGWGQLPGAPTAFLILEHVEPGHRSASAAEALGRQLARQHQARQARYGLDHDNFIGRLPQPNRPSDSWIEFYRDCRLAPQRDLASRQGRLPESRARMLEHLMSHLDRWIDGRACQPSLLHGDLWGGNWMASAGGEPILIDPAVAYGDRELDLAMTALFGGFPSTFYGAYRETFPLAPGHEGRQPLYQLYYLLAHLNLFGETYGPSVDEVLRRYA